MDRSIRSALTGFPDEVLKILFNNYIVLNCVCEIGYVGGFYWLNLNSHVTK